MKLNEIITARNTIASLYKEKVSPNLAYKFIKFIKNTQIDEEFAKKEMQRILDVYGEKDENGKFISGSDGGIKICEDKKDECYKEIESINNTEVDDVGVVFTLSEFEELRLSAEDINAIFSFIKE